MKTLTKNMNKSLPYHYLLGNHERNETYRVSPMIIAPCYYQKNVYGTGRQNPRSLWNSTRREEIEWEDQGGQFSGSLQGSLPERRKLKRWKILEIAKCSTHSIQLSKINPCIRKLLKSRKGIPEKIRRNNA